MRRSSVWSSAALGSARSERRRRSRHLRWICIHLVSVSSRSLVVLDGRSETRRTRSRDSIFISTAFASTARCGSWIEWFLTGVPRTRRSGEPSPLTRGGVWAPGSGYGKRLATRGSCSGRQGESKTSWRGLHRWACPRQRSIRSSVSGLAPMPEPQGWR